jgi:hypothetical protein
MRWAPQKVNPGSNRPTEKSMCCWVWYQQPNLVETAPGNLPGRVCGGPQQVEKVWQMGKNPKNLLLKKVWISILDQKHTLGITHFRYVKLVKTSKVWNLDPKPRSLLRKTLFWGNFWPKNTLEKCMNFAKTQNFSMPPSWGAFQGPVFDTVTQGNPL